MTHNYLARMFKQFSKEHAGTKVGIEFPSGKSPISITFFFNEADYNQIFNVFHKWLKEQEKNHDTERLEKTEQ